MSDSKELSETIQSLNLDDDDDEINNLLRKALSSKLESSEQIKVRDAIHKSIVKEKSKALLNLFKNNSQQFLHLLQNINDSGSILVDIAHKSHIDESQIQNLLSLIRSEISQNKDVKYYLGLYSNIITNFKYTNPQHLDLFLKYVGNDKELENLILVIIIQDLQLYKKDTEETIQGYLELLAEDLNLSSTQFKNLVSTLSLCFPIVPELCSKIYMDDNTKTHIAQHLNSTNDILILKLFSNSSLVENCRTFTVNNYFQFLLNCFKSKEVEKKILASLVLVKLWTFIQVEQKSQIKITDLAEDFLLYIDDNNNDFEILEYSIEGLIYLSLFWEVRELMRVDVTFIENLIKILKNVSSANNVNSSIQYGILSILSNITKLKEPEQQNPKSKLKNVTTPQTGSQSQEENQENIKLFNKDLLIDDHIISILTTLKTYQSSSNNNLNEVINIIYNLSFDQSKSTRVELVKQGALKVVISYLVKNSVIKRVENRVISNPSKDDIIPEIRLKAIRSLSRMLICINPELAFEHFDIKTCIPFLIELLGSNNATEKDSIFYSEDDLTTLDKYESLLSLTNIASIDKSDLKIFIIYEILPFIDSLILLNDIIQISIYELLNNLISEPILLSKFYNLQSNSNKQRLIITLKLLGSENLNLQIIIAKFLVNSTNFDMINDVLIDNKDIFDELFENILQIITTQSKDQDLITPVSYILVNLAYALANQNKLSILKSEKFRIGCNNVLKNGNNESKEAIKNVLELCNNN
ncbi:SHE4 [Candida pseudojiufengensis]|uniref:SHE4 n=1 Tax=Candida pseudojiufengensis TaxID=497109 RepID=UPI0022247847|nr:SHE4 [Candida pseudojiufengensis]KAI5964769.1 SHE4 [Candida pseudojiufengensis]